MKTGRGRSFTLAVLCFLIALSIRLFVFYTSHPIPLFGDEKTYILMAQGKAELLDTQIFLPGWPVILEGLLKIFGSVDACRIFTIVIGSINCALVFLLGRRLWNPHVGWVAFIIQCFYPEHIFYSHFLYAEIGLEFLILLITTLIFSMSNNVGRWIAGFQILGVGLLYKHVIVIPAVALSATLLWWKPIPRKFLPRLWMIFITPLLLYSLFLKVNGKDPTFWINSPLRNIREWSFHQPLSGFEPEQRMQSIKTYLGSLQEYGFPFFFEHVRKNIFKLWSPYSYVALRINWGHYEFGSRTPWIWITMLFYLGILFTGIMGLIKYSGDDVWMYSCLCLFLLTAMGLVYYTTSRFRVPFSFILVLYSSRWLTGYFEKQPASPLSTGTGKDHGLR